MPDRAQKPRTAIASSYTAVGIAGVALMLWILVLLAATGALHANVIAGDALIGAAATITLAAGQMWLHYHGTTSRATLVARCDAARAKFEELTAAVNGAVQDRETGAEVRHQAVLAAMRQIAEAAASRVVGDLDERINAGPPIDPTATRPSATILRPRNGSMRPGG